MSLVPEHIKNLLPYVAGKPIEEVKRELRLENIIKLASNENPLGPSLSAIEALNKITNLHRYPDSSSYKLRKKLALKFNLKIDNVILGSGSEGIMSSVMRTFLSDKDEIITAKNSFIGFRVLANASGIKTHWVPMKNYHYDLIAMSKFINDKTKLIYLANPDNPMGTYFNKKEFDKFMNNVPNNILVILDEAYFEYVSEQKDYPDSMIYRYDNVITLRTFSKIYGLAGLRIGYGFAHKNLIDNLMKVKLPFEPSTTAQIAAIAALDDLKHIKESLKINKKNMDKICNSLESIGIFYIESYANFVTIRFDNSTNANLFCKFMLSKGIILRNLKGFGLDSYVRITIGNDEETNCLIDTLYEFYS